MPTFDFTCEVCGHEGREWRKDKAPRFCNKACMKKGTVIRSERKWVITPHTHVRIREAYQGDTGKGQINALARALKLPRWKVSRYAVQQGWLARTRREPDWTEQELSILSRSAHRVPERIQFYLKRAGFSRSVAGIVLKRKRMRFLQNLEGQSARSLSECFGVDVHCIQRWIGLGYLRAMKRGTHRIKAQGGDIWLIKDKWVREFILEHVAEVDLRKVDKYWFVDLLAGDRYGLAGSGSHEVEEAEGPDDLEEEEDYDYQRLEEQEMLEMSQEAA